VHRLFAITFVYIVIGLSGLGLGYARPIIEIPKRVFVKSHEMRLGDLARLKGFSKKLKRQLAQLVIGPSPMGGTQQRFPHSFLKGRLQSDFRNKRIKLPSNTQFKLPKVLIVERKAKVLKGKEIQKQIESKMRSFDPNQGQDWAKVSIPPQANLTLAEGAKLKIKVIGLQGQTVQGGKVAVDLVLKDGPRLLRKQRIFARVDLFKKAYALNQDLQSGYTIKGSDFVLMRVPQSKLQKDFIQDPREAIGSRLKRKIKANHPLRNAWLWSPPLVKRGERVQMTFRRGGIFLSAQGEALGNGRRGDMIKVRNSRSKKILSGRVIGRNQVEMEF
jgi:flagella basal body P-ring formation protein FlgA